MISVSNNTLMLPMLIVICIFQRGILPVGQNRVSSSVRDGYDKYSYTRFGPEAPAKTGGPLINAPYPVSAPVDFETDCSKINGRMICCDIEGECSGYTGPHPRDNLCYFDDGGEVCF